MSPIRASERAKYPADWSAIVQRIRARAGDRCEFVRETGIRCGAPHNTVIARNKANPEIWWFADEADKFHDQRTFYLVTVVLTTAHLNHDPSDNRDENLKAGCQLHHLRHDAQYHARNAAATRRAAKNNGELFPETRP